MLLNKIYSLLLCLLVVTQLKAQKCITGDCENGTGTFLFTNGDRYKGEFANGKRNGKGVYYYIDGSKYDGEWKDDKKNGKGFYSTVTIITQYGLEKDSKKDEFVHKNTRSKAYSYEGNWVENLKQGLGIETWDDGDKYEGSFSNNSRNGSGIYIWEDGSKYTGNWKDNIRDGNGTMVYADGSQYVGTWKDDIKFIDGKYDCSNGYTNVNYIPNTPLSEIVYRGSSSHEKYTGNWELYDKEIQSHNYVYSAYQYYYEGDQKVCAYGQAKWINKTVYIGLWKNNRPNGCGVLSYENGSKFIGEFRNGKETPNGKKTPQK